MAAPAFGGIDTCLISRISETPHFQPTDSREPIARTADRRRRAAVRIRRGLSLTSRPRRITRGCAAAPRGLGACVDLVRRLACRMRCGRHGARIREKRPRAAQRKKSPLDGAIVQRGRAYRAERQKPKHRKVAGGFDMLRGEVQLDFQALPATARETGRRRMKCARDGPADASPAAAQSSIAAGGRSRAAACSTPSPSRCSRKSRCAIDTAWPTRWCRVWRAAPATGTMRRTPAGATGLPDAPRAPAAPARIPPGSRRFACRSRSRS